MRNGPALLAAVVLFGAVPAPSPLERAERDFAELRTLQDLLDVAEARGAAVTEDGGHVSEAARQRNQLRAKVRADLAVLLDSLPPPAGGSRGCEQPGPCPAAQDPLAQIGDMRSMAAIGGDEDRAALLRMRDAVEEMAEQTASETPTSSTAALRADTYERYGDAARAVRVGDEVIDRLTVLTRLGQEPDPARRRELFLSLRPVWAAMNGDNTADSPYRRLARAEAEKWRPGSSPVEASAQALSIPPADLERWLVRVLERWRDTVAVPGEPWDHWYAAGEVSRLFAQRLPLARLREVNDRYYRDLGADPVALAVSYDLDPREGKTPVAFTTFGSRPTREGGRWQGARAWVFATYRVGGFDNLGELLHETGHAVHISAIRTRPAFADWPDSDPFTEALGDLMALEAYDSAWQRRYLGAEAPRAANLRAKYASIMLDVCWALFEWRMHREPGQDPNAVWTDLTREYLKIAPHPELSWWAARGQLVHAPGYMMNYAIGAALAADLRARARGLNYNFSSPRRDTYAFLSERLYRFGRARPSRQVIEAFLGRGLTTEALISDLQRWRHAPSRTGRIYNGGVARYRFGVYEADDQTGELTRSSRLVHVQHQPFRALVVLLERSGQLVTRDELRTVLWGDATHVDFDRGLNFALRRLRIALGDDPRQPVYIETVPRRGYRFVAPVTRLPTALLPAANDVVAPAPSAAAPRDTRRARRPQALLAVALLLLLVSGPRSPVASAAIAPEARAAFAQGEALARTCRKRESVAHFREALRFDPRFAAAHAAMADVYLALGEQGELLPGEAFPRARAEAERALSLEERSETRLVLGAARFYYDWDWAGARRDLERAVVLEPDSTLALTTLARYMSAAGEHARAIALVGRAEAVDPSSALVVHESGLVYARARRFDEATRKFLRAGTLRAPGGGDQVQWAKWNRQHVMLLHQHTGAALAAREDALEIMRLSNVPQIYIDQVGDMEPARAVAIVLERSLEIARADSARDYVPPVRIAVLAAALGRDEDALFWLSRAQELRSPSLVYALADPLFDHLRSHPRFRLLTAQIAPPLA